MLALIGVVLGVLLLLLLLLAVPLELAFRFEGIEPLNGQVVLRWLFGLVRFRIAVPGAGKRRPAEGEEPPSAPQPAGKGAQRPPGRPRGSERERKGRPNVLALLREAELRQRCVRLLSDVMSAAHLSELKLRVRLGLGDPADTGRLWAIVGPLGLLARRLRNADVRIEPAFMEPVLEFQAQGRSRLIPLQLLALAIGFVLSPVSVRAWRTLMPTRGSHA
jgi:hypothetical protein